jgi:arylsulfatase
MVEDRTELNDLSQVHKPQVTKMKAAYEAWAQRCGVVPWDQILARRAAYLARQKA